MNESPATSAVPQGPRAAGATRRTPPFAQVIGLAIAIAIASGPADAQTWTPAAKLGATTASAVSLSMNALGDAEVAWAYAPGTALTGLIGFSQVHAGQAWPAATYGFGNYDPSDPGIGLDDGGGSLLVINGGQIDNFNSAVETFLQPSIGAAWAGGGWIGTNVTMASKPLLKGVRLGGHPTVVWLAAVRCALEAGNPVTGLESVLTTGTDCSAGASLALNADGTGLAVFRTKAGLVRAATRASAGTWSGATTLQAAGSALPASLAAATDAAGRSVLVWSQAPSGSKVYAVWAADVAASGAIGAPVQVSAAACTPGVAATTFPDGSAAVFFGQATKKGSCDATGSLRDATGAFGAARALTSGAHAASLQAVSSPSGQLVLAWSDGSKGGVYAASGSWPTLGTPVKLGAVAAPQLAAGGGWVTAAWCTSACYASSLALP